MSTQITHRTSIPLHKSLTGSLYRYTDHSPEVCTAIRNHSPEVYTAIPVTNRKSVPLHKSLPGSLYLYTNHSPEVYRLPLCKSFTERLYCYINHPLEVYTAIEVGQWKLIPLYKPFTGSLYHIHITYR